MASTRESTIDRRAAKRLHAQMAELTKAGFVMVTEEYGEAATGKTTRARALEAKLTAAGKDVRVLDGIWQRGSGSGVQVWAKG